MAARLVPWALWPVTRLGGSIVENPNARSRMLRAFESVRAVSAGLSHVGRLRALLSLDDFELDLVAFGQ